MALSALSGKSGKVNWRFGDLAEATSMNKIPNSQNAVVEENKITGYLLSEAHQNGKHKARFFTRFGFSYLTPGILVNVLKNHALKKCVSVEKTEYGVRYVVDGLLESPDGRNPLVRSVWFIEDGGSIPRFVTAYPV